LTHTQGVVAVVVAAPGPIGRGRGRRRGIVIGIGIDAERDRPLPSAVAERVMDPVERAALGVEVERDGLVVFSAKEAVFKALNPLTGRWLEFEDVTVRLAPDTGAGDPAEGGGFEARLTPVGAGPADPTAVRGRWLRADGVVLTGCHVEVLGRVGTAETAGGDRR
jgi:4'-phosphopantetheinyl transferase EntD